MISETDLQQFTGTDNWYRHNLNRKLTFTDGVKYLADSAGAYWLIDEVALHNIFKAKVRAEEFQVWTLTVTGSKARLVCDDGNGNKVMTKRIEFTDFPLPEVKLFCTGGVIMLPSEY